MKQFTNVNYERTWFPCQQCITDEELHTLDIVPYFCFSLVAKRNKIIEFIFILSVFYYIIFIRTFLR